MSVPIILYHANCQDGFTAAWACWLIHPDWEYIPAFHGYLPSVDLTGRVVGILDFSYPKEVMIDILSKAKSVTVFDHHKTGVERILPLVGVYSKLKGGMLDITKSGARLAWEAFHPLEDIPRIIQVVEDRDLWRFQHPNTKELSQYIFSYDYSFANWNRIYHTLEDQDGLAMATQEGRAIIRQLDKDAREICAANKFFIEIAKFAVWCVNVPPTLIGHIGPYMLSEPSVFYASYFYDGQKTKVSLRSDLRQGGLDVSEIAKLYGGGGHKEAAGFELNGPLTQDNLVDSLINN